MSLEEITAILKLADPFQTLSDEQLKLIGFVSDTRKLAADEILFSEGAIADGAYILVSGALVSSHAGSKSSGPALDQKGMTFGELALIVNKPRPATVTATRDSELIFVPRTHFKRLIENYPDLAAKVAARIKLSINRYVHALGAADVHQ
ncbi:cyclic nucleotide-binding domain-containing protein [Maritalea porphyrae]|uniref:cyclic nucleotide-binding domain-containing protein n=1 Tax=Maritalea porphyrae TaxID=880732 RepID=UPI0022AED650|nr:cyclic nucleotide-binding domain-containing protein [Maritalea porphyrae]MCZ4272269.1 cyclic nucleotide-binding domain-containing protein [Maritalea porphyrae]